MRDRAAEAFAQVAFRAGEGVRNFSFGGGDPNRHLPPESSAPLTRLFRRRRSSVVVVRPPSSRKAGSLCCSSFSSTPRRVRTRALFGSSARPAPATPAWRRARRKMAGVGAVRLAHRLLKWRQAHPKQEGLRWLRARGGRQGPA